MSIIAESNGANSVMECKAVATLLIDYLERRLAPEEKMEIENHFSACAECDEFLRAYNSTVTSIQNLREDKVRIPDSVKERLQAVLRRNRGATSPSPDPPPQ